MNPNTHFYLYAKGWYVKGDVEEDLKIIMGDYSGIDPKKVDMRDVNGRLLLLAWHEINKCGNGEGAFLEFCSKFQRYGLIQSCLSLLTTAVLLENEEQIGKPNARLFLLSEDSIGWETAGYNFAD